MPLSDDQKAMLRLLAREQSYEDIAALMGLSVGEVVSRAQGAVAQLESEGIPAPTLPAAPGGTAPAPGSAEKAPEPAPPVEKPQAPAKAPEPAPAASRPPSPPRQPKQPRDKNMLIAIGGGIVGVIVIVVLAVLLISNSGGDGDDSTTAASGGDTSSETVAGSREATTADLRAVDGSEASGSAEFGRVEDSLALGIDATGVDPAPKGQIYMVWLAESPRKMLPLTALVANKAGRINASYQVPTEAVVYLASGDFDRLVITRTVNSELRKSLEQANQDKDFPTYTGDPVLEGEIVGPIVGAAERLEERQK
ncbi:MAG: hypothetical protein QOE75_298 [Solirubrobacterales bacterium]|jgi:hypothetical protein|nr:hypothetical protein [Solirubrobacterales bacterium]